MRVSLLKIVELSHLSQDELERQVTMLTEQSGRAWYGAAQAAIRKCLLNKGDKLIVSAKILELKKDIQAQTGFLSGKNCSLNALESFFLTDIPKFYKENKLEKIILSKLDLEINGVQINVNPDLVYTIEIDDKKYVGGIKFNIAQKRNLTPKQRIFASDILYLNLINHPGLKKYEVVPEFCVCLDVFQKSTSKSKQRETVDIPLLDELTRYIKKYGFTN